ncbi:MULTISPECIES: FtsB family cell division protein [Enterococcus]|uniref:Cell division protein DivIC n=1 Tax=Enterococcus diestrammenae TaxID=1155073 RepID=A0ABV0EYJ3_9ENTE|nr:septum formation initiator family protein [Enterococcus diestrammenae]KAF1298021.1 septum formation initiator [Enterococcus diestrammenae]HIX69256.1 septum formation initiator family protein [Candidatus Enterococcus stercoravium]
MMQGRDQKVTQLDNDFAKAQTAQLMKEHRQAVFRKRRLGFIFTIALLIFGFVGFQLYQDYQQVQKLQTIKEEAVADHDLVAKNVATLEKEVAYLNDEDYVAKLARNRFFYSKDGETVYPTPEQNEAADAVEKEVQKALEDTHSSTATTADSQ